ncbi:MAG: hypothetical protein DMD29_05525 [Gemmatimonadetes bacterium]|nr:MAG: hypothetical protein DMD29_05525 [Gemmatimonadota bacterium]
MPSSVRVALSVTALVLVACSEPPTPPAAPSTPSFAKVRSTTPQVQLVVDVSQDTTAQNETPLAVNPLNPNNWITGANDWNFNDGCAVNASFDGGRTWTPTLPNGFIPGLTAFTNDPAVAGTGIYEAAGDPAVAFGPDGTAYFACQAFIFSQPPFPIALFVSRSSDGGRTWLDGVRERPVQVSQWNGNGKSRGDNGQFPDHESIAVDASPTSPFAGSVYVTWVQFNGFGGHSPVQVASSRDGARTFSTPISVTKGPIRNNQDARIAIAPDGTLYLTFDNGIQGGKGTANYVTVSKDGGQTWSPPFAFSPYNNPVCQVFFTSAPAGDLTHWSTPVAIAPGSGDRFGAELSVAPDGRLDVMFDDRSYSGNTLVDVTYAASDDGGATWRSVRVSTAGFDPSLYGVPFGSTIRPFIGDYNAIVSLADRAGLAWTGVGPMFGRLNTNLEIFFGSVMP